MNIIKITCFLLIILFGAFMFVYGGYDDSPGAQGLGGLAVIIGLAGLIKIKYRR
jgi:hypothetical protein